MPNRTAQIENHEGLLNLKVKTPTIDQGARDYFEEQGIKNVPDAREHLEEKFVEFFHELMAPYAQKYVAQSLAEARANVERLEELESSLDE